MKKAGTIVSIRHSGLLWISVDLFGVSIGGTGIEPVASTVWRLHSTAELTAQTTRN